MTPKPTLFDSERIKRNYARAQRQDSDSGFLRHRALEDMNERLQAVMRPFENGLLLSPFSPDASVLPASLNEVSAAIDIAPQSRDLVASLLHLHLEENLPGALQHIREGLRPDGLFLGALFGERTLYELRAALLQAESEYCDGVQARIIPFVEIKALGGLMQHAGFALPVVDVDRVAVRYASLMGLMRDLRAMGQANPLAGTIRPLRRDVIARAEEIYRASHGDDEGRLPASFEIVHICGWAPHESQQKPLKPGSAQISLTDVLGKKKN